MKVNIRFKDFIFSQVLIVSLILALALLSYILGQTTNNSILLRLFRFVDVGHEQSIPTYFSVINILLSSVLLFVIYRYEKINNNKGWKYWLFLSLLLLFLSVDESIGIHESYAVLYRSLAEQGIITNQLEHNQWLPFGILFIFIVGISLIPFFRTLSRKTLSYFILSGIVFVTGAIGFEYLGALMLRKGYGDDDLIYLVRRLFEEGFEMFGIVIFNCALFHEILKRKIFLDFSFSK